MFSFKEHSISFTLLFFKSSLGATALTPLPSYPQTQAKTENGRCMEIIHLKTHLLLLATKLSSLYAR